VNDINCYVHVVEETKCVSGDQGQSSPEICVCYVRRKDLTFVVDFIRSGTRVSLSI